MIQSILFKGDAMVSRRYKYCTDAQKNKTNSRITSTAWPKSAQYMPNQDWDTGTGTGACKKCDPQNSRMKISMVSIVAADRQSTRETKFNPERRPSSVGLRPWDTFSSGGS